MKNSRISLITENLNGYPFYEQRPKVDRTSEATSVAISEYNQVKRHRYNY